MRWWAAVALLMATFHAWAEKPVVVLVPGFFNSLADGSQKGPYFSRTIVQAIQKKGFDVFVVNNLEPVGHVERNAKLLLDYLHRLEEKPGITKRGMILIGHSAGGLYSLRALTLDPFLPVRTLATISTPYGGVPFVERLTDSAIIRKLVDWFDLDALYELTPQGIHAILDSIRMPTKVRMLISGGTQRPCFLLSCAAAERLSWVMSISGNLTGEASDGVVPIASALDLRVEHLNDQIALEHWEQVLDYHLFGLLGVANTGYVEREQRRFYSALIDSIDSTLDLE